ARLGPLYDLVHVDRGASTQIRNVHSIGDEPAGIDKLAKSVHRGQSVLYRKFNDLASITDGQRVNHHDHRLCPLRAHGCKGAIELIWVAYRLRLEHNP